MVTMLGTHLNAHFIFVFTQFLLFKFYHLIISALIFRHQTTVYFYTNTFPAMRWLLLPCLVLLCVESKRMSLFENRKVHWQNNDKNHKAPFYGQPEQIHLSYGGKPNLHKHIFHRSS